MNSLVGLGARVILVLHNFLRFWFYFFFFNDTATTEIYTLSLHDALPIWARHRRPCDRGCSRARHRGACSIRRAIPGRSEEHTSELQSRLHLVCRLLLEKKKNMIATMASNTSMAQTATARCIDTSVLQTRC